MPSYLLLFRVQEGEPGKGFQRGDLVSIREKRLGTTPRERREFAILEARCTVEHVGALRMEAKRGRPDPPNINEYVTHRQHPKNPYDCMDPMLDRAAFEQDTAAYWEIWDSYVKRNVYVDFGEIYAPWEMKDLNDPSREVAPRRVNLEVVKLKEAGERTVDIPVSTVPREG